MTQPSSDAWRAAVADALGFVLGGLAGWQAGRMLGVDFIASTEWDMKNLGALLLIVLGTALGRWLLRRLLLPR